MSTPEFETVRLVDAATGRFIAQMPREDFEADQRLWHGPGGIHELMRDHLTRYFDEVTGETTEESA